MTEFDFRRVLETLADPVVAADADHRIVFANRAVEIALGFRPDALIGRPLAEVVLSPIHPNDLGMPVTCRVRSAAGDRDALVVMNRASGDGGDLFVTTIRPGDGGGPEGDLARKLRAVLGTIPVGVILTEGPEGRLTLINAAADRLAGEPIRADSYREFVEKYPLEGLDGRRLGIEERPLARTMDRHEGVRDKIRYRRKDGREFILEITTAPFPGPSGGAVTTFADITDRFRLEQESVERASQFRALLDHLPVGVAYFDKMAVCRAGNGPARRFLGRSRTDIIGVPADELFAQAPALREALVQCVRDHSPHSESGVSWPDASRPGSARYLDWQFQPLGTDPAKPRGAIALIVDVTESTLAEAERSKAMEAAEEASRRKTQFLSAVSHDLRTPINALSLQAELLGLLVGSGPDAGDELRMLAGDIRAVASNLIELINDLLDLTRFDSGVVEYHVADFYLDAWLGSTLAALELTARARGLEFSWTTDRPGRIIRGDRVKLGRVLVNLVGNAVKFTETGEVAISAGADAQGQFVLEVRDTGPGIPEEGLDRIFDEFAQLRNPERDRTKGTGLGLAICRRLVEGVGGRLTVESCPGRGSVFRAIYPPDHIPPSPSLPEDPESSQEVPAIAARPAGILLVEDDPSSRSALARLLERDGHVVAVAGTGPEALEAARAARPVLVILDLMLPGMDGGEVLRRLRDDPETAGVKVLVLTGDLMGGRTSELRALDVDGILAKPVDFDELRRFLARQVPAE